MYKRFRLLHFHVFPLVPPDKGRRNFANGLMKGVTRNVRPPCYFVGSKLIHPANPLMYEPNPARSPLIALSCLAHVTSSREPGLFGFSIKSYFPLRKCIYRAKPTSYRFVKHESQRDWNVLFDPQNIWDRYDVCFSFCWEFIDTFA